MHIDVGDEMEIFVENGRIVLEKYIPGCIFCGSEEKVSIFNDKYVCAACIEHTRKTHDMAQGMEKVAMERGANIMQK